MPSPLTTDALDSLWIAMADVYGHRWTSSYGADPVTGSGTTWAKGLRGITGRQLGAGIQACITSAEPWPPTLPEFRALCLGVPPFAAVRLDSAKVSPFTRLVWQHMDGHRFRQSSADQSDRLLREAYELAREHVMSGGELPEPAAGEIESTKPAKPVVPATAEEREARIAAARAELSGRDLAAGEGAQ